MVKAKTLQVVWHSKEPVYSVDFHPNGQLVTGGADKEVKVWEVARGEDGYATVRHLSSLTAHLSTVNCVRFSPTGKHLASSGDGGEVLVWEPVDPASAAAQRRGNLCEDEGEATWRRTSALKGHSANGDVMDLCWSADGTALVSAAINNEALVFAMEGKRRGELATRFTNHKHFVQGVAWDPAQQFVVTQSADRTCRVYAVKPPAAGKKSKVSQYMLPAGETARDMYCTHTLSKRVMASGGAGAAEGVAAGKPATHPLFADERVPTFFRRPTWSPDGSLLVVPAGIYKTAAEGKELNTAYVYARGKWNSPIMHLPGHTKPVVAVRFCPVLFERDDGKQQGQEQQAAAAADGAEGAAGEATVHPFDLPYKMVLAVATLDSVVLYDTQSPLPLAVLGHLHYDSITDLAWSSDGQYLAVSSRDCYCSIAAFDAGELGKPLPQDKLPAHIAKRMASAQRVAEPLKPPAAAATPAVARPAAPQGEAAAADPKVAAAAATAATPAAGPAEASKPVASEPAVAAGAGSAAAPAGPTAAAEKEAAEGAAAAAPSRKRIQPEPVTAPAVPAGASGAMAAGPAAASAAGTAAAAAEGQPVVKKAKRIVPEAVGPAPAVVGDSQQGGAEPSRYPEPPAPAGAKAPRRIVPEPLGGSSSGAAGAKAPRRIVAEPIGPPTAGPGSAAKSSLPAESAASGKAGKRITPTPLRTAEAASQQFGGAVQQQSAHPAPSEQSRDGMPASGRRITPIPVGAAQALPQVEERSASVAPKGGIAALAAALGAQAAQARKE